VAPTGVTHNRAFGEFLLLYEAVRQAAASDGLVLEFPQSTYRVAADLGRWGRGQLERV